MKKTWIGIAFMIALCALSPSGAAQWIHQPEADIPRTAGGMPDLTAPAPKTYDGKPDLSGVWTLEAAGAGIRQLKPGDIQPWAEALHKQREEDLFADSPGAHCLPSGFVDGLAKIVQTPKLLVMLGEDLTYRQIFLDGRELPKDPNPAWMGYSVGRWDGDALVVQTTGLNERVWLERGYPHTERLVITERIRRPDFGHLALEVTYSDPEIYAQPWTMKLNGTYTADTDLIEYVCAENEKDHPHLVGKNSDDARRAVKLPPEALKKYVGSYEFRSKDIGFTGSEFVYVTVALEDGELRVGVGDGPKEPMLALSDKTFTGFGGYIDFNRNDKGEVTQIVIRVAEGDFPSIRKKELQ